MRAGRSGRSSLPASVLLAGAAVLFVSPLAQAATRTWGTSGNPDTNWATPANWGGTAPVSGDSLVFGANGSASNTLTNTLTSTAFNIGLITFNTPAPAYIMTGNPFTLTTGITNNSGSLQTFSNTGGLSASTATETFNVTGAGIAITTGLINTGAATQVLAVNGAGNTLTLGGYDLEANGATARIDTINGTGNVTINGVIKGSTAAGSSLTYSGTGTLTLNGAMANTYTGTTRVSRGTELLDFSNLATPTNLINAGSSLALGNGSATSILTGGTLDVLGHSGAATAQTFASFALNTLTGDTVAVSQNGATSVLVNLNAITRGANSTVDFTLPTGTLSATNGIRTSTGTASTLLSVANGAAYATVNGGADFAAKDPTNSFLIPLAQVTGAGAYTPNTATGLTAGANIDIASGVDTAVSADTSVTTIRFNQNEARTLTNGTGINLTVTGGILATPTVAPTTGTSTITGGNLRAGATTSELVIQDYSPTGLTIGSNIVNSTAGASSLTLAGTGTTTLAGTNTYTGSTAVNGSVNLTGTLGTTAILVSNTGTFTERATGVIGGAATLTLSGTATLGGANTFTGNVLINNGSGNLVVTNPAGLGSGAGTVTNATTNSATSAGPGIVQFNLPVPGTGTGSSAATPNVIANPFNFNCQNPLTSGGFADIENVAGFTRFTGNFTITGTGGSGPNLVSDAGNIELAGALTVGNAVTGARGFDFGGAGNGLVSGVISNGTATTAPVQKDGSGTWTLTGANTYTGSTTVNQGTLTVSGAGTLGNAASTLTVNNNNVGAGTAAVLNLSTTADTTTGTLTGTLAVPSSGVNTATINNGPAGRNFTVNQTAAGNYGGAIAGAGNFLLGSGSTNTLTLSGANTYTGTTAVNAGTLLVTGSTAAASAVTVGNGMLAATLGGTGTVGGTVLVNSGATLLAGTPTTVGTLTTGAVTLATGSIFNALAAGPASYSSLVAANTTSLANAMFVLTLAPGATFDATGDVLTLISSPVTGQFTNPNFSTGGYTFTPDYSGTTGPGFVVDVTAVPEPSTWACSLVAGLVFLGGAVRRRAGSARVGRVS